MGECSSLRVALISCTKSKRSYRCKASELYTASSLFRTSYRYAKFLGVDKIYILSAKYGLINENEVIDPYELTLKTFHKEENKSWGMRVKSQLLQEFDPRHTSFILLAGNDYISPLLDVDAIQNYSMPLKGMQLGTRIAFMQAQMQQKLENKKMEDRYHEKVNDKKIVRNPYAQGNTYGYTLHKLFNALPVYTYQNIDAVPFDNGIYIFFEKGEHYYGMNRIVRVGSHRSQGRLRIRLKDHFLRQNKDGSIFRKNIGKAILNKEKHPYLKIWSLDTSSSSNKDKIEKPIQSLIENRVSDYMKENLFFTVIRVDDKEKRLELEEKIIASIAKDQYFKASTSWLGKCSTEYEIRESGMWLKQGLDAAIINDGELEYIIACSQNEVE